MKKYIITAFLTSFALFLIIILMTFISGVINGSNYVKYAFNIDTIVFSVFIGSLAAIPLTNDNK